jgi:putative FmdB family regulatory protein
MPIYHYHCQTCNYKFIDNKPMADQQQPECMNCKTPMQRIYGVQTIIFKGNGWGKDR